MGRGWSVKRWAPGAPDFIWECWKNRRAPGLGQRDGAAASGAGLCLSLRAISETEKVEFCYL